MGRLATDLTRVDTSRYVASATIAKNDERTATVAVDAFAAAIASALVAVVIADVDMSLRPPLALLFALFVPGWTLLRLFDVPATVLSLMCSIGLSIAVLMTLGELLVLRGGWRWMPAAVALGVLCAAQGVASIVREVRLRRTTFTRSRRVTVLSAAAWTTLVSVMLGNALVVVGLRRTVIRDVDVLGLIDTLSPLYWLGVAIIIIGLVIACVHDPRWAWLSAVAVLVALHGLPGLLQPHPRFGVAWIHSGFAGHIAQDGTLLTSLDARFSWAGFFAGGGLLQRLAGTDSLLWLVRYAPLFYNGCSMVLVGLLARRFRASMVQTVGAVTLFCCLNWIGQDYFAPQATGFLLYLMIIVVVLTLFPGDQTRRSKAINKILRPEPDVTQSITGSGAVAVLVGLYAVVVAITISHQLTPGFLMSATLLLVLFRATRLRVLPIFTAIVFLAWLSFGANAYWAGHLDTITSSVGQVGSIVRQNVSKRAATTDPRRQVVVAARLFLPALSWAAAGAAVVVGWFKRRTPVALLCLLVAPFPMLALQPYGGEMALRVCYFTLPAVTILVARLLLPEDVRTGAKRVVLFGFLVAALVPVFVLARFGNEAFESYSDADVRMSTLMYDVVPNGSRVYVTSRQTLLQWQRLDQVNFHSLPDGTADEVTKTLIKEHPAGAPVYIMLSESQSAYQIVRFGRPRNWMEQLRQDLERTGKYEVVATDGEGVLLRLVET